MIIDMKRCSDSRMAIRMSVSAVIMIMILPFRLSAQERSFYIEDWEAGINRRQPPAKIMDAVGLKTGMVVGEVGAGTGRMTLWLASRVGYKGKIYANDIDDASLDRLKKRCRKEGFDNVEIIRGETSDPKLPPGTLDIAFMINVYHHLDDPVPLVRNIIPSLKPDGILAIVECDPDKVDWGDEEGCHRKDEMRKELAAGGFEIVRIEAFLNEDNIYIAKPLRDE